MSDMRVVNVVLDKPGESMFTLTGTDCNVYWLGEPDNETKNAMYREYARTLHAIAATVDGWSEEE